MLVKFTAEEFDRESEEKERDSHSKGEQTAQVMKSAFEDLFELFLELIGDMEKHVGIYKHLI